MAKFDISCIITQMEKSCISFQEGESPAPQSLCLQVFVKLETLNISDEC